MKKAYKILLLCLVIITGVQAQKQVRIDNFESKYVQARNVEIWLPKQYFDNPDQKFPVLYMHDGQNVFNKETSSYGVAWEADDTAQKLIDSGKIKPCIIVTSWNTGNTRYMEYFPEKASKYFTPKDNEVFKEVAATMNTEPKWLADTYLTFMTAELKPYIDKNYRTLPDAENTSVCGSSMGGLISMYALCEYPEVFGQAACISTHWPLLMDNNYMAPSEAVREYMRDNLPKSGSHRIYFDYGTATLDQYYELHQKMIDVIMKNKGYAQGKDWVTRKFPGAEHNEKAWQARMDVILTFLYKK